MEWIGNNPAIFPAICTVVVAIIGLATKFFKRSSASQLLQSKQTISQNQTQTVNVYNGAPNSLDKPIIKNQADVKTAIHILFIDDEKFDHVDVLKNAGWVNTKRIKDVKRIDCADVLTANVIFVDINGVGCSLYPKEQGLGVAAKIKEMYPEKYVVAYSAQPQQLNSLLGRLDAILPKDADPYQYMNILENLSSK